MKRDRLEASEFFDPVLRSISYETSERVRIVTQHAVYTFRQTKPMHERNPLELVDINGDKAVSMGDVPTRIYVQAIETAEATVRSFPATYKK